jgi:transcription termination/antitermination protein NusG
VTGFIGGSSDKPTPISEREADSIMQQVKVGTEKPRPKFSFEPGELVRVVSGPFADFNGTVEDVNFEKSKLRVAVSIFGRSTPVELDFSQVEKG